MARNGIGIRNCGDINLIDWSVGEMWPIDDQSLPVDLNNPAECMLLQRCVNYTFEHYMTKLAFVIYSKYNLGSELTKDVSHWWLHAAAEDIISYIQS